MPATASLPDLPTDALLHLLEFLSARDVAALALTCRLLRSCARQEAVWRVRCGAWLAQQAGRPNAGASPSACSPIALLDTLRLPTYRALYTALHALGSWPEGLFYAVSEAAQPRGGLLLVRLGAEGLQLLAVRPCSIVGPPARAEDAWRLSPSLSIEVAPSEDGSQASLALRSSGGLFCSLELVPGGQAMAVHSSLGRHWAQPAPGSRLVPPADTQEAGAASSAFSRLAAYLGGTRQPHVESMRYCRVPLPPPQSLLPAPGEPPGMALLRRCQGVYFGSYGPHGLEVLSLSACGGGEGEGAPPRCPISGPRLQALKLVGDPNVPALKHSFVVDASSCRLGPYDPAQDDPFAPEGGPARPCLSFWVGATQLVDLEERPVVARFMAVGCINVVPGQWDPQWVPASFLLYGPPLERVLTVVFEDEDQPFRHAIDYHEFPFAGAATVEG